MNSYFLPRQQQSMGCEPCKMTPNINFWLVWQVQGMKKDSWGMKRKKIYVVLINTLLS